jgi:hypothetical protein
VKKKVVLGLTKGRDQESDWKSMKRAGLYVGCLDHTVKLWNPWRARYGMLGVAI